MLLQQNKMSVFKKFFFGLMVVGTSTLGGIQSVKANSIYAIDNTNRIMQSESILDNNLSPDRIKFKLKNRQSEIQNISQTIAQSYIRDYPYELQGDQYYKKGVRAYKNRDFISSDLYFRKAYEKYLECYELKKQRRENLRSITNKINTTVRNVHIVNRYL